MLVRCCSASGKASPPSIRRCRCSTFIPSRKRWALLACVGLYGLLAFALVQRTSELGIRMALGAQRRNVVWMVVREAWLLVAIGIAVGVPAAIAVARLASNQISGLLFRLEATDPLTIVAATLALATVATFAAYLPARRASRVDPMVALRAE